MAEQDRPQQPSPDTDTSPEAAEPAAQGDSAAESSAEASVNEALSDAERSLSEIQQAVADAAAEQGLDPHDIAMLGDVDLNVTIELGRTEMLVEDVLKVGAGSVIELDKLAGDPVDVHVNGRLVARGEVLVLNDNFCIRISEIVADLQEQARAAVTDREPVRPVGKADSPAQEQDESLGEDGDE